MSSGSPSPADSARKPRGSLRLWIAVISGGVVLALAACILVVAIPWRYWIDTPKVELKDCEVTPYSEASSGSVAVARVSFTVINWSWVDQSYVVVIEVTAQDGTVIGSAKDNSFEVPARHQKTSTAEVPLTQVSGACGVSAVAS